MLYALRAVCKILKIFFELNNKLILEVNKKIRQRKINYVLVTVKIKYLKIFGNSVWQCSIYDL